MPSDIRNCKRKKKCFKAGIRNDFTQNRRGGGLALEALGIMKTSDTKPRNGPSLMWNFSFPKIYRTFIKGFFFP